MSCIHECRISRASRPIIYLLPPSTRPIIFPDYLHLIIQACHYLPILALITGSASSHSDCTLYYMPCAHYTRFCSCVLRPGVLLRVAIVQIGERNPGLEGIISLPLYSCCLPMIILIRIKADCQFTSFWSSRSELNQMIATDRSPFDWLIDTSVPGFINAGALWAIRVILAHVWLQPTLGFLRGVLELVLVDRGICISIVLFSGAGPP